MSDPVMPGTNEGLPDRDAPDDLLYEAWGVIANAHAGNWDEATAEWREAAERWRDHWHDHLRLSPPAPSELTS